MRQPGLEIYQEQMIVIALICAGIAVTIVVLTILAAIYKTEQAVVPEGTGIQAVFPGRRCV